MNQQAPHPPPEDAPVAGCNRPAPRAGHQPQSDRSCFHRAALPAAARPWRYYPVPSCASIVALLLLAGISTLQAILLPPIWRWSNPTPHGANIVDMAAVDTLVIQVGERGQIYTSDDLQLWIPRDSHTTAYLRGVTIFGGRIVITGAGGTVLFADNPSDYYLLDLETDDWLESVAASPDRVVAVGDNAAIYTSTNAVVWQRVTPPFNHWLRSVAYGSGLFVTVGEDGLLATSPDGLTWTRRNLAVSAHLNRITWAGNHFLVMGDGGLVLTSMNGTSWQTVNTGALNSLFAAAGEGGNPDVVAGDLELRLQNDALWMDQLDPARPFPAPYWTYFAATWDGTSHLLSGWSGMFVEGCPTNSTSPVNWLPHSDPIRSWLWDVIRTPDHYLAVGDLGTILSSPNGIDWELEWVPQTATNSVLLGIAASSNLIVAAGSRGTLLWATNAYVWHPVPPPHRQRPPRCLL